MRGLTLPGASSDKGATHEWSRPGLEATSTGVHGQPDEGEDDGHQLRQISPFLRGSGGNGCAVLHSDLRDARLRRPLLDAGPLRDEASASRRETGHHVDGCVWRGGYLGGRFLSNRNLFVGGMALQVVGCACIA